MSSLDLPGAHEDLDEGVALVTAFGPFPGQPHNPTERIVDDLAGDEHVVGHVLDVSYRRAQEQLDELVRMVDPIAVVCFGVARGAEVVRIEQLAWHRDDATDPDVDGVVRRGQLIDDGPPSVPTRLPVEAMLEALGAAGVAAELSDDPGRYVCNHVMRHTLRMDALLGRPVGFVHVPPPSAPGFDVDRIALAGRIVVDLVVAHARRPG